ncbi:MAG TPA: GNAT family N-acetyltransferase [Bacteroidales bacterium]|nr:GNAT family N-acetyltransferase [Bacteroidales bacterium]
MTEEKLNIDIISCESQPVVYRISNSKKYIGSLLILVHVEKSGKVSHVEVLHIYIDRSYRGKGYAQQLVGDLQKSFPYIITGWLGSEPCGRNLFLKMGFSVKKALRKRNPDTLEWYRGEDSRA